MTSDPVFFGCRPERERENGARVRLAGEYEEGASDRERRGSRTTQDSMQNHRVVNSSIQRNSII